MPYFQINFNFGNYYMSNCFCDFFYLMDDFKFNNEPTSQTTSENNPRDSKRNELKEKLSVYCLCVLY